MLIPVAQEIVDGRDGGSTPRSDPGSFPLRPPGEHWTTDSVSFEPVETAFKAWLARSAMPVSIWEIPRSLAAM